MLPEVREIGNNDVRKIPNLGYKIDFDTQRITGMVNERESLIQAIRLRLMTQRYKYPIFSHEYGTDYSEIYGQGYLHAMGSVQQAVTDSLIWDDRIEKIDNFIFEKSDGKMKVSFRVKSVFGDIDEILEVDIL